ncbi:head decoration protein [Methylobacterium sp. E-041]|uniref:head decoration protein n=1 Tax=Methylobacterium sp. E-041 TaxID=2836573 RepID=UPI001FB8C08E|nr:head decoration protein [Methylobacterium sp. E-041]MCJ2108035.1 head decoration protein [Methylobacterium sp. E-041]
MALNETNTYVPEHDIVGTMPVYSEPETYLTGALVAKRSVVGRVTASGKLKLAVKTATDGSQKPIGIAVRDVDASAADAVGPTYKAGVFDPTTLTIDPSFSVEDVRLAFEGSPLFIRTPLSLSTY